jgi:hypothetical protein
VQKTSVERTAAATGGCATSGGGTGRSRAEREVAARHQRDWCAAASSRGIDATASAPITFHRVTVALNTGLSFHVCAVERGGGGRVPGNRWGPGLAHEFALSRSQASCQPVLAGSMQSPDVQNGQPVPMANEFFVLSRGGIGFKATSGRVKTEFSGTLFLSTLRMVIVSNDGQHAFDIPLATLKDEKFNQPIFGANNLSGASPPLDLAADAPNYVWVIKFNNGGVGTFLPFFFRLLGEMRNRVAPSAPAHVRATALSGARAAEERSDTGRGSHVQTAATAWSEAHHRMAVRRWRTSRRARLRHAVSAPARTRISRPSLTRMVHLTCAAAGRGLLASGRAANDAGCVHRPERPDQDVRLRARSAMTPVSKRGRARVL